MPPASVLLSLLVLCLAGCGGGPQNSGGKGGGAAGRAIAGDGGGAGTTGGAGIGGGTTGSGGTAGGAGTTGGAGIAGGTTGAGGAVGIGGAAGGTTGAAGGAGAGNGGAAASGGASGSSTCTPGDNKTCNEDPSLTTARGNCGPGATCNCGTGAKSPYTGRCLNPGDDGSGCEYASASYSVGAVVPVPGCGGLCTCSAPGTISCPPSACVPCVFSEDYSFTLPSGMLGFFYRSQANVSLVRFNPGSDVGISCSVPFPTCGSPTAIDASDIIADIANADVQRALGSMPAPVYGDRSVANPPMFTLRAQGGSFSIIVGHECATATATCDPTPAGVQRLVSDVNTSVSAALADSRCASLR